MKIVFIGHVVSLDEASAFPAVSVAGNKMQYGIIDALNSETSVEVISSIPHPSYTTKNGEPLFVKKNKKELAGVPIYEYGYVNIWGLKQLCAFFHIKSILKRIKKQSNDQIAVITYNTFSHSVLAAKAALHSKASIFSIIADVPSEDDQQYWIKRYFGKRQMQNIEKLDGLIVLSEHTSKDYAPKKPYMVMDGGCNPADYEYIERDVTVADRSIVFTGSLDYLSGIGLIIDAMHKIHAVMPDVKLNIYGDGYLRSAVESQVCDYIVYHGKVSNAEILQIQRNAGILVCPRYPDEFVTRYTFPSKMIEYLCAGVPTISNRLAGISQQYDEYIHYADPNPDAWAEKICHVLRHYECYRERAERAREFVLEERSWRKHALRILSFVEGIGASTDGDTVSNP